MYQKLEKNSSSSDVVQSIYFIILNQLYFFRIETVLTLIINEQVEGNKILDIFIYSLRRR